MEDFNTILYNTNTQIVEKKSKFIADLCYAETEKEAEEILLKIKK